MNRLFFAFQLSVMFFPISRMTQAVEGLHKVPDDSICVVSIDVDGLKNTKALSQLPWKMLQGSSLDSLGVDLTQLSRVDASVGGLDEDIPAFSIELTSSEPMALKDIKSPDLGPVETSRRDPTLQFRKFAASPVLVAQASPTYSFVGTQSRLIKIWQQTESNHALVVLANETNSPVRVVVDVDAVRPLLIKGLGSAVNRSSRQEGSEEVFEKVRGVVTRSQYFKIDLAAETNILCSLSLVAESDSEAERLQEDVQWLIGTYLPSLSQKLGPQFDMLMRGNQGAAGGNEFKVTQDGDRVKIEGAAPMASFAIAAGLILPAIQTARNNAMKK